MWLAPATRITYWALEDGSDPRSLPVERRFRQRLTTAPREWQGTGVLRVIPWGLPFQVLHFWHEAGSFAGWYMNFESPATRSGSRLDAVDWHLDLWLDSDGTPAWKDEDEAEQAVTAGHLSETELTTARTTGAPYAADVDALLNLIGDWRGFTAPTDWSPPVLPSDWTT